jgi:hypothetical protein
MEIETENGEAEADTGRGPARAQWCGGRREEPGKVYNGGRRPALRRPSPSPLLFERRAAAIRKPQKCRGSPERGQ